MATRDLERLSAAIKEFANSARYNFLKTLQVGRFVNAQQGSLGVVSEFTFEKLVELGSKKLAKLRWLTPDQEQQLIALLKALGDGESAPAPNGPPPRRRHTKSLDTEDEDEVLNSADVENQLRSAARAIKSSPYFEQVSAKALGSFWDDNWPRAPFEEALTVEQLTELDLSMLMKKRTMTNRRIRCMSQALERALASIQPEADTPSIRGTGEPRDSRTLRLLKTPPAITQRRVPSQHPWSEQLGELSALVRAAAEHYLDATIAIDPPNGSVERLLHSIPDHIAAEDFVGLASSAPLGEGFLRRIAPWTQSEEFSDATVFLRSALESPGVGLARLAAAVDRSCFSAANAQLGVTVVIRALGACEVRVGRTVCKGVWTLNPLLASELLKLARRKPGDARDALRQLCPSLDPELAEWMTSLAKSKIASGASRRKNLPH